MAKPLRIASLLSSATEMLYGIGLGGRVVAVSHECDYPEDATTKPRVTYSNIKSSSSSAVIDEAVQQSVRAAEPLYAIDIDLLEQLQPDLIVTQAQCDVCAVKYDDVLTAVERMDAEIPVMALNPASLDDVFDDILRLGDACDCTAPARDYVQSLRARVDRVTEQVDGMPAAQRPRTALIEWIEPIMLAGNWMPELLDIAGGACELTATHGHSRYIAWSRIAQYDPEVIIVCPCGFDLQRTVTESRALRSLAGWSSLTAVRNNRVYAVDGNAYFNRSGPRLVDSIQILAHLLHPQLFEPPFFGPAREFAWRVL